MHRHKIGLLRQLSGSEILGLLPGRVLKLYLVLLVSAEQIGREETIDLRTVHKALGREVTRLQMQRIGAALERCGLATLRPSSRRLKSGGREDTWRFRILGRAGGGSDGARKARAPRAGRGR